MNIQVSQGSAATDIRRSDRFYIAEFLGLSPLFFSYLGPPT